MLNTDKIQYRKSRVIRNLNQDVDVAVRPVRSSGTGAEECNVLHTLGLKAWAQRSNFLGKFAFFHQDATILKSEQISMGAKFSRVDAASPFAGSMRTDMGFTILRVGLYCR